MFKVLIAGASITTRTILSHMPKIAIWYEIPPICLEMILAIIQALTVRAARFETSLHGTTKSRSSWMISQLSNISPRSIP